MTTTPARWCVLVAAVSSGCVVHAGVSTGFVARDAGLVHRGSCDAKDYVRAVGASCERVPGAVVVGPEMDGFAAKAAFDDDICRSWNSGRAAPWSIGLDFGERRELDAILLVPRSSGPATHSIEVSSDGVTFVPALVVTGELLAAQSYAIVLPQPASGRYLRVATSKAEGPVAWREIVPLTCP
jgi:hypothetical protein